MYNKFKQLIKLIAVSEIITAITMIVTTLVFFGKINSLAGTLFICMIAFVPILLASLISVLFFTQIKSKLKKFIATAVVGLPLGLLVGAFLWPIVLISVFATCLYFTFYVED